MLTVLESLQLSSDYLEKKGIESARMNAELLLADILKCGRLDLYLKFDKPLTDEETSIYRDYIARRGKFEPLQYILGKVEFYGISFMVNPDVLIPRQETEILVEQVLNFTGSGNLNILDIGTGSGCIAISLSKNLPNAKITAIDISRDALKVAWQNIKLNNVENCELKQFDIINDEIAQLGKFDVIVSNPPYVEKTMYSSLQKEIVLHEPRLALTDEDDGYKFYRKICQLGKKLLNPSGTLFFEAGDGMSIAIKDIMAGYGYEKIELKKDYLEINRVVKGELE